MRERVSAILRGYSFLYTSEIEIQEAICKLLAGLTVQREYNLSRRDRIDFLVRDESETVGIEVKVQGSTNEVMAQLMRYADHPGVDSVVLVTLCARHRSIPERLREKPLDVVFIGGIV